MKIKAIGFDWDGTLYNGLLVKIKNSGIVYADEFGVDAKKIEESFKYHCGIPRRHLFDKIAYDVIGRPLHDNEYDRLSRTYDDLNDSELIRDRLYPGIIKVLSQQRSSGRIIYLSSSVPHTKLNNDVKKLGMASSFIHILGSSKQGNKGLGHTKYIVDTYNIYPKNIVFVGDGLGDVDLSNEAGIWMVGITNTHSPEELLKRGANRTIFQLSELGNVITDIEREMQSFL